MVIDSNKRNQHSGMRLRSCFTGKPSASNHDTQIILAVKQEQERFLTVLEHLPVYIYLRNENYDIVFANKLFRDYFGDPRNKKCYQILVGGKKPCQVCRPSLVLSENRSQEWEWTASKIYRTFHVFCYPFIDYDDSRLILEVGVDITRQKDAEKQQEHLVSAIDQARESFILADKDGIIQYANPAFELITGTPVSKIVNTSLKGFVEQSLDKTDTERFQQEFKAGSTWRSEINKNKPDGTEYYIEISVIPVCDPQKPNVISNFVAIIRDITEERKLKWHLEHKKRLEALGALARGIAHDFNNILSPLIMNAELALQTIEETTPEHRAVGLIRKAAKRGRELVEQILAFARPASIKNQKIQMIQLLNKYMSDLETHLPDNIFLKKKMDLNDDFLRGDPVQIEQIFFNLCDNAIKSMSPQGGTLEINLSQMNIIKDKNKQFPNLATGTYLQLVVKDSGQGIEPKYIDLIFDPFFTTKRHDQGSGLGLSIVHNIVSSMGGFITVSSKPDHGTTFEVFLPQIETKNHVDTYPGEISTLESKNILIVDDDEDALDHLKEILVSKGHTVVRALSGNQALTLFTNRPHFFDLIITDYFMPEMNGVELMNIIKNMNNTIPIILCSGIHAHDFERLGHTIHDDMFLSKPFNETEIDNLLRSVFVANDWQNKNS